MLKEKVETKKEMFRQYREMSATYDRNRVTQTCAEEFIQMLTAAYENILWKDATIESDQIEGNTLVLEFKLKPYVMVLTLLIVEKDDGFYFNVLAAYRSRKEEGKLYKIGLLTRLQRDSLRLYSECVLGKFGKTQTDKLFNRGTQYVLTRRLDDDNLAIVELARQQREKKDEPKPKRKRAAKSKTGGTGKSDSQPKRRRRTVDSADNVSGTDTTDTL